jgi:hypothetical protein
MRRHPVVLAFIARHVLDGAIEGARQGYRTIRSELGELVPPHMIDAALRDCRTEGRRLAAAARAVELVERASRPSAPTALAARCLPRHDAWANPRVEARARDCLA